MQVSALGDVDAVIVGDYHFPNTVAWALAGEARGDDDRMLALLEPYSRQQGRVLKHSSARWRGAQVRATPANPADVQVVNGDAR
ncbi:MAG: hypothetical protein R2697_16170 [Ilumatobacteraceae bacterium]